MNGDTVPFTRRRSLLLEPPMRSFFFARANARPMLRRCTERPNACCTAATGASRAELIRRAVRDQYGESSSLAARRARAHRAFGAWKDRSFTGDEYVRAIRSGDMNKNLRRIGA